MRDRLNVITVFSSKIIIAVLGVIILSLETHNIEPSAMGEYSLLSGVINAGVSLCISWVGSSALRYYDKNKENLSKYNSTILIEGVVSMMVLIIGIIILGLFVKNLYIYKYLLFVVLLIIVKSGYEIYEKVLRAASSYIIYSVLTVFQYISNVVLFYFLIKRYKNDVSTIFVALILSLVLFDVLAIILSKSLRGIRISNIDKSLNKTFIDYGIPMIGTWAISWLLNYSDRYMINIFYTTKEVGIYTTAYTASQSSIGIFITSITLTFFPLLIKKWNESGRVEAERYVNKILDYYLMFMIPALVGLVMVSQYFYGSFLDRQYSEGASVIALASFGFLFMGFNNILYKLWQLEENTRRVLGLMAISLIINILTNAICLPLFGYIAAAYTTIFSYFVIFTVAFWWIRKTFSIEIHIMQIVKSIVACIPMVLVLLLLNPIMDELWGLIISVISAGCLYLIMQLLLGNFRNELRMIISVLKR